MPRCDLAGPRVAGPRLPWRGLAKRGVPGNGVLRRSRAGTSTSGRRLPRACVTRRQLVGGRPSGGGTTYYARSTRVGGPAGEFAIVTSVHLLRFIRLEHMHGWKPGSGTPHPGGSLGLGAPPTSGGHLPRPVVSCHPRPIRRNPRASNQPDTIRPFRRPLVTTMFPPRSTPENRRLAPSANKAQQALANKDQRAETGKQARLATKIGDQDRQTKTTGKAQRTMDQRTRPAGKAGRQDRAGKASEPTLSTSPATDVQPTGTQRTKVSKSNDPGGQIPRTYPRKPKSWPRKTRSTAMHTAKPQPSGTALKRVRTSPQRLARSTKAHGIHQQRRPNIHSNPATWHLTPNNTTPPHQTRHTKQRTRLPRKDRLTSRSRPPD